MGRGDWKEAQECCAGVTKLRGGRESGHPLTLEEAEGGWFHPALTGLAEASGS